MVPVAALEKLEPMVYCKLMCITETRKSTAHHKCCQILSWRDPDGGLVLRVNQSFSTMRGS